MSIIEDYPLSVETPAIPAHCTNTQANTTHMGAAVFRVEGITLTSRRYVTKVQDVIKPAIKTFLETCNTNPRIAAVVATPALLGFLLVLAFFTVSTLVLVVWTIFTITSGIIFVIIGGIISLFFKLLLLVSATLPLAAIATGLLVGANMVSQSIISRMPLNSVGPVVTQTVKEIDWKLVIEQLINFGKNLGPGSAVVLEQSVVLRAALHNFFMTFKSGIEDLNRVENLRNDPPTDSTAETSGEPTQPSQGNSNSELRELQPTGPTEGLKRRAPFPRTSEDVVDGVLGANERSEP